MQAPVNSKGSQIEPSIVISEQNELILLYEKNKKIIRWLIIISLLCGITYVILAARAEKLPHSALSQSILGSRMASAGKMMVLSSISQDRQEILISHDSGNTFFRTGDSWSVQDSAIILGIAQDSSTVLALEKTGLLHYKLAAENNFRTELLVIPVKDSTVLGFTLIPGTDSMYVYGRFPGILAFSWKNPKRYLVFHTPDVQQTISLAVSPEKNIVCILEDMYGSQRWLYYGRSIVTLRRWYGGFIDFDYVQSKDSVQTVVDTAIITAVPRKKFPQQNNPRYNDSTKK